LFFHHLRVPLGLDRRVKVWSDELTDWTGVPESDKKTLRTLVRATKTQDRFAIGRVLEYHFLVPPQERLTHSTWHLNFYGKLQFFALTGGERDQADPRSEW
jgi:hypothetical protein